jgi:hypothetical protein
MSERIKLIEKCYDTENRIPDFPACSIVPQPTAFEWGMKVEFNKPIMLGYRIFR